MNENFDQPQILKCPSCGASLAVPNADTFECDYCGKQIVVPLELRPRKVSPDRVASANLTEAPGNLDREEVSPTVIDSGLLQQKRIRRILVLAIFILILFIGCILTIVFLFLPTSSSTSATVPKIEMSLTPLLTMVQFARLQMSFGNQAYAYDPEGSFSFSFGEQGERAGQFSLSTCSLNITAKDYLVISDAFRLELFDAHGNYLGKSFTIDYNIAEDSM
jgi:predicted RNA-binding Zn-ribbon protein involved in translation (DUF1610 family)